MQCDEAMITGTFVNLLPCNRLNGEYFNNDLDDGALYVGYEVGYDKDGALDYFWQDEKTEFFDEVIRLSTPPIIEDCNEALILLESGLPI